MTTPPGANESLFDRFAALTRRELGADEVRVVDAHTELDDEVEGFAIVLPDGRRVLATFAVSPPDRDALERRFAMLAATFAEALASPEARARTTARPSMVRSLRDELRALALRARAGEALVIDAHSPLVWGAAYDASLTTASPDDEPGVVAAVRLLNMSQRELLDQIRSEPESTPPESDEPAASEIMRRARPLGEQEGDGELAWKTELTKRALEETRNLSAIATLPRGGTLHHVHAEDGFGYVARSFAGIYVLVIVYADRFDELRAERALVEALPRIERLVIALPPRDPSPAPMANVVRLRRPRR